MALDGTWRAEALTLDGALPLHIVVAAQAKTLGQLANMFSSGNSSEADAILSNVLSETVNLVAGQIKARLARDYTMGLPHQVPVALHQRSEHILSAWLVNRDASVKLWTAVIEGG